VKIKLPQSLHCFHWSACTKPGKWAVMYMCVTGINLAYFYDDFSIAFWNCSNSVFFFHFTMWKIVKLYLWSFF